MTQKTTTTNTSTITATTRGKSMSRCKLPFPWKLYQLLEDAHEKGFEDIVSWSSDGKSFQIHNPTAFSDTIMIEYFRQKHFKSFTRQLYIYGFAKTTMTSSSSTTEQEEKKQDDSSGTARASFAHRNFIRGNKGSCLSLERNQGKGDRRRNSLSSDTSSFSSGTGAARTTSTTTNSAPSGATDGAPALAMPPTIVSSSSAAVAAGAITAGTMPAASKGASSSSLTNTMGIEKMISRSKLNIATPTIGIPRVVSIPEKGGRDNLENCDSGSSSVSETKTTDKQVPRCGAANAYTSMSVSDIVDAATAIVDSSYDTQHREQHRNLVSLSSSSSQAVSHHQREQTAATSYQAHYQNPVVNKASSSPLAEYASTIFRDYMQGISFTQSTTPATPLSSVSCEDATADYTPLPLSNTDDNNGYYHQQQQQYHGEYHYHQQLLQQEIILEPRPIEEMLFQFSSAASSWQ